MKNLYLVILLVAVIVAAGLLMGVKPAAKPDVSEAVYRVLVTNAGGDGGYTGSGSAVHIGNGYFLTAAHVLNDGKAGAKLEALPGEPVRTLWVNIEYDLALLKVERMWPDKISAPLGCHDPALGSELRTIGYPLQNRSTFSSFGRVGDSDPNEHSLRERWKSVFLTDAVVIYGMSGGGAFDGDDRLVGVVVGLRTVPMGMGASITGMGAIVPTSAVCELLAR